MALPLSTTITMVMTMMFSSDVQSTMTDLILCEIWVLQAVSVSRIVRVVQQEDHATGMCVFRILNQFLYIIEA